MSSLKSPPFLHEGDKIGIISPSSVLDQGRFLTGKQILENAGFQIVSGRNLFSVYHNFAGTDEQRKSDFQEMLDDPKIKAIIMGRGGYGITRYLDQLDFSQFKSHPKWLIGFSDITALHQKINALGFQSIHGPMVVTLANDDYSTQSLIDILKGKTVNYSTPSSPENLPGQVEGQIIGGNLCLLAHGIGSPDHLSYEGNILFLEEINEYYYNIDRMMVQLKRSGVLSKIGGLVIGDFSSCKENSVPFGKNVKEIVLDHVSEYHYPIAFDVPIGHLKVNWPIICGKTYQLNIEPLKTQLIPYETKS